MLCDTLQGIDQPLSPHNESPGPEKSGWGTQIWEADVGQQRWYGGFSVGRGLGRRGRRL